MPGSDGVSTSTEPTFEAAGQVIGLLVPAANCALLQVSRPFAEEGLMPAPSGRTTFATFSCELWILVGSGSNGIETSTVAGSGESTLLPVVTPRPGSNG